MRLTVRLSLLTLTLLLPACTTPGPQSSDDTGSSGGGDPNTLGGTDTSNGDTEPETSQIGSDTGDPDDSESSAEGPPVDMGGDPPDDDSGSETGDVKPPGCESAADPNLAAEFSYELPDWPWAPLGTEADCILDTVGAEAGMAVATMTCDVEGSPLSATLRIAEAPEGPVAWAATMPVHLRLIDEDASFEIGTYWKRFELRDAADDGLLVLAIAHDKPLADWFAPIVMTPSRVCSEGGGDPSPSRLQLDFSLDSDELTLFDEHRGALQGANAEFAIDVKEASTDNCCHYKDWFEVLIRRVQ